MAEPKIIAEFPKCQACGSEEKVSELGCAPLKASGKIPQETFTVLRQEVVPIEQPLFAGVSVSCIATFYDVCAKCGTPRCTRAAIVQAPVQMAPGMSQHPGGKQSPRPFRN
jgi:hypothetical protein